MTDTPPSAEAMALATQIALATGGSTARAKEAAVLIDNFALAAVERERLLRVSAPKTDHQFTFASWSRERMGWDTDTTAPGIDLFGAAVQVWSICQNRAVSIAEAARAFNVAPERIVEAVEEHYWMLLIGPDDDYERLMIEHDGE